MESGVMWQGLGFVGVFVHVHMCAFLDVWCPCFSGNKKQQFCCFLAVIGHLSLSSSLKAAETFQRLSVNMWSSSFTWRLSTSAVHCCQTGKNTGCTEHTDNFQVYLATCTHFFLNYFKHEGRFFGCINCKSLVIGIKNVNHRLWLPEIGTAKCSDRWDVILWRKKSRKKNIFNSPYD